MTQLAPGTPRRGSNHDTQVPKLREPSMFVNTKEKNRTLSVPRSPRVFTFTPAGKQKSATLSGSGGTGPAGVPSSASGKACSTSAERWAGGPGGASPSPPTPSGSTPTTTACVTSATGASECGAAMARARRRRLGAGAVLPRARAVCPSARSASVHCARGITPWATLPRQSRRRRLRLRQRGACAATGAAAPAVPSAAWQGSFPAGAG